MMMPVTMGLLFSAFLLRILQCIFTYKRCEIFHIMSIHLADNTQKKSYSLLFRKGFINQVHSGNNPL